MIQFVNDLDTVMHYAHTIAYTVEMAPSKYEMFELPNQKLVNLANSIEHSEFINQGLFHHSCSSG